MDFLKAFGCNMFQPCQGEGFLEHKLPDVSSHTEAYENGGHKGNLVFCTFFFYFKQLQGE